MSTFPECPQRTWTRRVFRADAFGRSGRDRSGGCGGGGVSSSGTTSAGDEHRRLNQFNRLWLLKKACCGSRESIAYAVMDRTKDEFFPHAMPAADGVVEEAPRQRYPGGVSRKRATSRSSEARATQPAMVEAEHRPAIYSYCTRVLGDRTLASDVAQQVLSVPRRQGPQGPRAHPLLAIGNCYASLPRCNPYTAPRANPERGRRDFGMRGRQPARAGG